jgi:hypothetical protein
MSHLLSVIICIQNISKSMHTEFPVVEHLSGGKVLKNGQTRYKGKSRGSAWELEVQEHPRKINIIIDDDNNNSNNSNNNK